MKHPFAPLLFAKRDFIRIFSKQEYLSSYYGFLYLVLV